MVVGRGVVDGAVVVSRRGDEHDARLMRVIQSILYRLGIARPAKAHADHIRAFLHRVSDGLREHAGIAAPVGIKDFYGQYGAFDRAGDARCVVAHGRDDTGAHRAVPLVVRGDAVAVDKVIALREQTSTEIGMREIRSRVEHRDDDARIALRNIPCLEYVHQLEGGCLVLGVIRIVGRCERRNDVIRLGVFDAGVDPIPRGKLLCGHARGRCHDVNAGENLRSVHSVEFPVDALLRRGRYAVFILYDDAVALCTRSIRAHADMRDSWRAERGVRPTGGERDASLKKEKEERTQQRRCFSEQHKNSFQSRC